MKMSDDLTRTGQAVKFPEAQETAAQAIEVAWRSGVREPVAAFQLGIRAWNKRRFLKSG
jgi:hypothetical protein